MISSSREKGCFQAKQEGEINGDGGKVSKWQSSSRQWSGFQNPRIVRVSRSFGGKDRHSKVCTIRGLRDRRIRLSVPTAIQLYDLQDRLGLNQPSKVIDWLLEATKDDIDKLPPLQFHQSLMANSSQSSSFAPFLDPNLMFMKDYGGEDYEDRRCMGYAEKSMEFEREITASGVADMKGKWIKGQEKLIFPIINQDSLPGLLNNGASLPSNSYNYHWESSSNLSSSSSQFVSHGFHHQPENFFKGSTCPPPLPSAHSVSPQLFFGPPSTMPLLFPTYPSYGMTINPGLSHTQNADQSHAGEDNNTD